MFYSNIKYPDTANGMGVRVSLFVSGCRLHCKGCFNEETWDFENGKIYTKETEDEIIEKLGLPWVSGLSLLGGDPLEPENQEEILKLVKRAKEEYPKKDIWLWTGRIYPNIPITEYTEKILEKLDYLIDGPFIEDLKDPTLDWRGSSNQRILKNEDL